MRGIISFLFLLLPFGAWAKLQGRARIDSLKISLFGSAIDSNKVKVLDELANAYKSISPDTGIQFARQELELATQLQWQKGLAMANSKLGLNYDFRFDYAKGIEFNLKALTIYEELGDQSGTGTVKVSLANIYSQMRNFQKGLEYNLEALAIFTELRDRKNIALTQGNIGNIYQVWNNYTKALEYDLAALRTFEEMDDRSGIARNLGNIGNIYLQLGEYEKALDYNFRGLRMYSQLGERQGEGLIVGNIGEIYLALAKDSSGRIVRGNYIPEKRDDVIQQAIDYLRRGIAICTETSMLGGIVEFNQQLSRAYMLAGDYKNALLCYKQYALFKDSIFTTESIQKLTMMDGNGERELKEKELELQQMQLTASKHEKRYYLAALATLILLSAGLFQRFHITRRTRRQLEEKNSLIAQEKDNADMLRMRAERSERFKRQFLANMSHEIRTPMNAVNGMTDLLLEKNPRPEQRHYLEVISRSSDILLHVINDILDLSKIEAGKLELETIDFSLKDTVRQVRETLSFRAEEKGLYLASHIDNNIPDVLIGDPFRLNQVLMNLGGNAIKFTEHGNVEIRVQLAGTEGNSIKLQFSVSDTGVGIAADKLPALFESFRQANSSDSRVYGGTGLGLSIARQLVELQGGAIWAESEVGKGAVFSFEISYQAGSPERLRTRTQQEKTADGVALNGLHILLVDDNEFNRMVAAETLRSKADITIDEAADGEAAVRMVASNDYDAVLMDIQMPVMNGLDATKHIRTKLPAPHNATPVIALTASLLRHEVDAYREAGMNACVLKPFKAWQLIKALAEVTGHDNSELPHIDTSESPDTESEAGVTNLAYLIRFCEGDAEKVKKFVKAYVDSVPAFIRKVTAAGKNNDMARLASQVHAFKPRWMLMGMKKTSELGTTIEQEVKEQQYGEISAHIAQLISYSEKSVEELSDKV